MGRNRMGTLQQGEEAMSDTPETKKQLSQVEGLFRLAAEANGFAEFARDLERQRNMILGALDEITKANEDTPVLTYQRMEKLAHDAIKEVNQSKQ